MKLNVHVGDELRGRPWLQTAHGRAWLADDPEAFDYDVEEIAHALSHLCRFAGHVVSFYSVAQHSVLVAGYVWDRGFSLPLGARQRLARAALLHDAAEAFVVDMPAPVKRLPEMAGYRALIERVERAIDAHFDLEGADRWSAIAHADLVVLATEKRDVRARSIFDPLWQDLPAPLPERIVPMSPELARRIFIDAWRGYGGEVSR